MARGLFRVYWRPAVQRLNIKCLLFPALLVH
jgi:hypothetical protein